MCTNSLTLLDFYKAIESTSVQMLHAAQSDDWNEVVRLEGACAVLIEQLREHSSAIQLSAEDRSEKHRIMLSILRHDAQMRQLVEPWLDDLSGMVTTQPGSLQLH